MTYRSPVADILFSLKAVAGLPELIGERLDGEFDLDTIASVISEAGRFATEEIAPLNRTADTVGAHYENGVVTTPPGFADAYRRWAESGWGGVSAPAEFGGMGLPHMVNTACTEIWNGASMAFALCPLLNEGAIGALKTYGSRELLDTYLEAMISGRWTGTMNLTEPQAGSDLAAVRTRAERAGDGTYRLFGQKSSSPMASTTWPRTSSISFSHGSPARPPARADFRCSSRRNSWSSRTGASERATTCAVRASSTSSASTARRPA